MEGDVFESAMDDLATEPEAPVHETAKGTVQLTSIPEAKEFIEKYDEEDEYIWFL